jgi:HAMP domain-containing protein
MLYSLTARAIVPVAVAVTGFVIVCCMLLYSVMKTDLVNDAINYEANQANTIIKSTRYAMLKSDRETVRNIIDNIGSQEGIEHVRIFNKKGLIMFSENHAEINRYVDKKTAGCISCHAGSVPHATIGDMERARRYTNGKGAEVIAITAPIYNDPACYTAACHFHTSGQQILGTLDIGVSAAPLMKTLSVMRGRMIVFSIMILILSVGGVAALLRRHVFIPLREIKEFTAKVNRGNLSHELSGISGDLTDLACDVRGMASQLRSAVEELEELRLSRKEIEERVAVEGDSV